MVMALFTYHLSSVSNLHLILRNLLLLVRSVASGTKSLALALGPKSLLTLLNIRMLDMQKSVKSSTIAKFVDPSPSAPDYKRSYS